MHTYVVTIRGNHVKACENAGRKAFYNAPQNETVLRVQALSRTHARMIINAEIGRKAYDVRRI